MGVTQAKKKNLPKKCVREGERERERERERESHLDQAIPPLATNKLQESHAKHSDLNEGEFQGIRWSGYSAWGQMRGLLF